MALVALNTVGVLGSADRVSYSDVGKYEGSRTPILESSRNIIKKLKEYSKYLNSKGVPHFVYIDSDDKKLFPLDLVYFKFYPKSTNLEVCINLKEGFNYKILESYIKNGYKDIPKGYLTLYESYWYDALYSVFLKSSVSCEELVWGY